MSKALTRCRSFTTRLTTVSRQASDTPATSTLCSAVATESEARPTCWRASTRWIPRQFRRSGSAARGTDSPQSASRLEQETPAQTGRPGVWPMLSYIGTLSLVLVGPLHCQRGRVRLDERGRGRPGPGDAGAERDGRETCGRTGQSGPGQAAARALCALDLQRLPGRPRTGADFQRFRSRNCSGRSSSRRCSWAFSP